MAKKKKDELIKTRRVTIVVPEAAYQVFKQATVVKNQAAVAAGEGLSKVSDAMREAMITGLSEWKKIDAEARRRAEEQMKKMNRKK